MADILRSTSDQNREISISFGPISGPWSESYCLGTRVAQPVATHEANDECPHGAALVKQQLELALCVMCMYSYSYSYSAHAVSP